MIYSGTGANRLCQFSQRSGRGSPRSLGERVLPDESDEDDLLLDGSFRRNECELNHEFNLSLKGDIPDVETGTTLDIVPFLLILTGLLASGLTLWGLVRFFRSEPAIFKQVIGAGIIEFGIILVGIAAIVRQAQGRLDGDPFVFWGYVLTALFILPVCVAWAFADRSRVSSIVMSVGGLTIAVMMWRTWEVAEL